MDAKKKKGIGLVAKLTAAVAVPMIALVAIGCFVGVSGMNGVSTILMKEELCVQREENLCITG